MVDLDVEIGSPKAQYGWKPHSAPSAMRQGLGCKLHFRELVQIALLCRSARASVLLYYITDVQEVFPFKKMPQRHRAFTEIRKDKFRIINLKYDLNLSFHIMGSKSSFCVAQKIQLPAVQGSAQQHNLED